MQGQQGVQGQQRVLAVQKKSKNLHRVIYWLKRVAMKNKALGFENTKEEGNQFFPLSIEVGSHVAIKAKACQNFVVHFEFLLYSYYLYVSRYLY